jgi:hypothetical protein
MNPSPPAIRLPWEAAANRAALASFIQHGVAFVGHQ